MQTFVMVFVDDFGEIHSVPERFMKSFTKGGLPDRRRKDYQEVSAWIVEKRKKHHEYVSQLIRETKT